MPFIEDAEFDAPLTKKFQNAVEYAIQHEYAEHELIAHYRAQAAYARGRCEATERHLEYLIKRVEELEARERARMGGGDHVQ